MKLGVYSFEDGKEPKDLEKQIKVLEKQLKIAVKCLRLYARGKHWYGMLNPKVYDYGDWAKETLKKIGVRS